MAKQISRFNNVGSGRLLKDTVPETISGDAQANPLVGSDWPATLIHPQIPGELMLNVRLLCFVVAALLALAPSLLLAQVTTATIYGRIMDPSGAAVPDAKITLLNEQTNARTTAD